MIYFNCLPIHVVNNVRALQLAIRLVIYCCVVHLVWFAICLVCIVTMCTDSCDGCSQYDKWLSSIAMNSVLRSLAMQSILGQGTIGVAHTQFRK